MNRTKELKTDKIRQDFELAFWQLTYLVVAPRRVYKQTYHQYVLSSLLFSHPLDLGLWVRGLCGAGLKLIWWTVVNRQRMSGRETSMFLAFSPFGDEG